jgi:hypothetical protein
VHPLDVEHEVLVLPVRTHHANGVPAADDHPVTDGPRLGLRVHVDPAGQILAVEQVAVLQELFGTRRTALREQQDKGADPEERWAFHGRPPTVSSDL